MFQFLSQSDAKSVSDGFIRRIMKHQPENKNVSVVKFYLDYTFYCIYLQKIQTTLFKLHISHYFIYWLIDSFIHRNTHGIYTFTPSQINQHVGLVQSLQSTYRTMSQSFNNRLIGEGSKEREEEIQEGQREEGWMEHKQSIIFPQLHTGLQKG